MANPTKKIRCALYDRVSTDHQAEEGISLDAQRDALTEYAKRHGYQIVGYYSDEGLTARKKMQNRKGMLRLLADVKAGKVDLILVTKLDRWFRNIKDYHNTQAILEAHGCNWKTIYEDYDTSTSNGRFAINIMLSVNENECDRDSERIKSVFAYKKKNRELLTGAPAYGYATVEKKLIKDPKTQPIVEDIINYYFKCFSKRNTIFYIQEKYGPAAPSAYKINRILGGCSTYWGEMYGIQDYCEPYLSPEQAKLIRSTSDSKTYAHTDGVYIFSQLLKCPVCGSNMTGFLRKRKLKDGSCSTYKRYRCCKKWQYAHESPCITEHLVERYMLDHVVPKLYDHIFTLTAASKACRPDNSGKLKAELSRLNLLFQKGRITEEYYEEQYGSIQKKLEEETARNNIVSLDAYRAIQSHFTGDWQELYLKLDLEHKRAFWKRFIKAIYFDRNTHKISGFDFLV